MNELQNSSVFEKECSCGANEALELKKVQRLPVLLPVHVMRWDRATITTHVKNHSAFYFKQEESGDHEDTDYELQAIITHSGKSVEHGHYVAHIKTRLKTKPWVEADGRYMSRSDSPKARDNEVCFLLYKQKHRVSTQELLQELRGETQTPPVAAEVPAATKLPKTFLTPNSKE